MARRGYDIFNHRETICAEIRTRGLTQRAAAAQIGIAESLLCKLLKGNQRKVSTETLTGIAGFLKVDFSDLLDAEGQQRFPFLARRNGRNLPRPMRPPHKRKGASARFDPRSTASRRVLVAAPFGDQNGNIAAITSLIREAAQSCVGLEVIGAHEICSPGSVPAQLVRELRDAYVVVFDLTDLNANVMFEMGIRYDAGGHMILVARIGTSAPFDIADNRIFFYGNGLAGSAQLRDQVSRGLLALAQPASQARS